MIDSLFGSVIFSTLYSLVFLIPTVSVAARRLHDTGRSGWWQLIAVIPIIGVIILLVFLVGDSTADNEYGVNRKLEV